MLLLYLINADVWARWDSRDINSNYIGGTISCSFVISFVHRKTCMFRYKFGSFRRRLVVTGVASFKICLLVHCVVPMVVHASIFVLVRFLKNSISIRAFSVLIHIWSLKTIVGAAPAVSFFSNCHRLPFEFDLSVALLSSI